MGKMLEPLEFAAMSLVRSTLSLTLDKEGATNLSDFLQAGYVPCPNYLDRYLAPTMISLPNLHKSKGLEARRFIAQFYIGKDL